MQASWFAWNNKWIEPFYCCRCDTESLHPQLGVSDAVPDNRQAQHPGRRGPVLPNACSGVQPAAELVLAACAKHDSHQRSSRPLSDLA